MHIKRATKEIVVECTITLNEQDYKDLETAYDIAVTKYKDDPVVEILAKMLGITTRQLEKTFNLHTEIASPTMAEYIKTTIVKLFPGSHHSRRIMRLTDNIKLSKDPADYPVKLFLGTYTGEEKDAILREIVDSCNITVS